MSKIIWDETGSRYYETGVNHGVLYRQNSNGTYGAGVPWNGLTSVTESPDGAEPTDLWADNIKYASMRSTESFGGTIEAYTYPEEFAMCDGSYAIATGVYIGQQNRQPFGFCFRSEVGSDSGIEDGEGYKLHIIYNATASPSESAYETINDSPDAITLSWEFTTTPVNVTGHKPTSRIVIDTTKLTTVEDKAKLAALEDMLYGTSSTDASLPSPDQIAAIFGGSAEAVGLTALSIGSETLTPTFAAGTTVYTCTTTSDSDVVTATPDTGATARITVNGTAIDSGDAAEWNDGANLVIVTVSKTGSMTTTYTIGVTKT